MRQQGVGSKVDKGRGGVCGCPFRRSLGELYDRDSIRDPIELNQSSPPPVAAMGFRTMLLSALLLSLHWSRAAVITGACERDTQCGLGLCCAVSLWLRGLRMCVPSGVEGDECHPFSHKVPYQGKRLHHTCPCLPHLVCTRYSDNRYRCTEDFKNLDF